MNVDLLIIETTVKTRIQAEEIAHALLEKKLAACCQISSTMTSHYIWKGELCVEDELVVSIKSLPKFFDDIEAIICALHPYEVPQIIAYKNVRASAPYTDWIVEVCNE